MLEERFIVGISKKQSNHCTYLTTPPKKLLVLWNYNLERTEKTNHYFYLVSSILMILEASLYILFICNMKASNLT